MKEMMDYVFETVVPSLTPIIVASIGSVGVPKIVDALRFSYEKRIKKLEKRTDDLDEALFKHKMGVTPKEWDERQKRLVKQVSVDHGLV